MKKVNFGVYCVLLSFGLSTVILPMAEDNLGNIARQYFNTSRGDKRSVSRLEGLLARIDALKQKDDSQAFAAEAHEVAARMERKLEKNKMHREMNLKAGLAAGVFK